MGSLRRSSGKPDPTEDGRDEIASLPGGHAVVARRVAEVLGGGHLLEERRLDRDPVHEPAHGLGVALDVVAEDASRPAVREEQRREKTHERGLARAILAEHGDALPAGDAERDVVESGHRLAALAAGELLAQPADVDGGRAEFALGDEGVRFGEV